MQKRWNTLTAGIILGLIWAVAHFPSEIQQGRDPVWMAWGTLGMIGMRILFVWLYYNTGKSLFAVIFFHAMANLGRALFPADPTHNPLVDYPYIHYPVIAIAAAIVTVLWRQKHWLVARS